MMALDGGSNAKVDDALLQRVKQIVRRDLKLGAQADIPDNMPFFGGDFDLDSLDVLLLLTSIEKEFGLKIPSEAVGQSVFKNVATLTAYIAEHRPATGQAPAAPAATPAADPLARLPHQAPFRFVSKVVSLREGESGEGLWIVTGDEGFFAGHFPGRPVVPGVLIAEALAQWSGIVGSAGEHAGKLAQMDVRFDQPVTPPAEILLYSKLLRTMGPLRQFEVTASVGASVIARGELTIRYE